MGEVAKERGPYFVRGGKKRSNSEKRRLVQRKREVAHGTIGDFFQRGLGLPTRGDYGKLGRKKQGKRKSTSSTGGVFSKKKNQDYT